MLKDVDKPVTHMEKYRKLWVYFNEYGKYGQIMINPSYVWATPRKKPQLLHLGEVGVWPLDEHNAKLLDAVHPRTWETPDRPDDFALWQGICGPRWIGDQQTLGP
jgi:hypothetical protein